MVPMQRTWKSGVMTMIGINQEDKTMKYSFRFLGLIAAASIVFFSCEKETALDVKEEVPETTDPATEENTTPEENTEFDPSEYLLSFGASFENDAQTKVDINIGTGELTLKTGDKALAYNGTDSAVYVYDSEESSFKAEGTPIAFGVGVQVFYPASEFRVSGSDPDLDVIFTMPGAITDVADLGAKNPLAGKIAGTAGNWSVTFKAVGSILQVGVTGDRELNSLTLSNTALDLGEGAEFTIGWNEENPTMATAGTSNLSMTITGLEQALSGTASTYYFLLPAGIAYEGLTVTAGLATADQGGLNTFDIVRGSGNVARNKVMQMSFYAGLFSGGDGLTEATAYVIANARDYKHISTYCADGYGTLTAADFLGAFYKQTANINFKSADLSDYMIGGASTPFTGTYNGKPESTQYTLSNFTISGTPSGNEGVAPIKAVDGAVLKNISISGASVTGGKFTAGLVGYAKGDGLTIQNCSIEGSTIADTGHDYGVGGLIGGLYGGTVTGCSGTDLTISTTASGKRYFGGLISYINGTVTVSGCELNGTTTITNAYLSGGIVGQINNANVTVTDCHNHSNITASSCNYIGGILGYATTGTVSHCSNDGEINGANSVAGIIGQFNGTEANVTDCVNTGDITASSNYAGGVVAYIKGGNISNCRSDATVVATGTAAGGLIGGIEGNLGIKVQSCFAKGNVKGTSQVGGFVGNMQADAAYIVNSLAASNVVATGKEGNQAAGGFVGYLKNATNGKNAWIGNCAVYDVIVKAPNQTSNTNPVRVGGFVGVHNKTTTSANSKIQNCYYQGTAERLGYKGGDDFITNPETTGGGYHGGIAGYSAAALLDCYSTPKVKANGSGGTYTNNTTLTQEFIYGNTNSNPAITTSTSVDISANTTTLGGVLSAVDATFSGMVFSDWDSYEEGGKYYYYPASLTSLGEDFYKK